MNGFVVKWCAAPTGGDQQHFRVSAISKKMSNRMPLDPIDCGIKGLQLRKKRLVYICDWLPPDFGAVGQYGVLFAREWAEKGWAVTLVGLTSGMTRLEPAVSIGDGSLEILRIHRPAYDKCKFVRRLAWTIVSNLLLLKGAFGSIRRADALLFTGSPPLMLLFIAPLYGLSSRVHDC
jgi:hypothetical protein